MVKTSNFLKTETIVPNLLIKLNILYLDIKIFVTAIRIQKAKNSLQSELKINCCAFKYKYMFNSILLYILYPRTLNNILISRQIEC